LGETAHGGSKIRGLGKVLSILVIDLRNAFIHGCQPNKTQGDP